MKRGSERDQRRPRPHHGGRRSIRVGRTTRAALLAVGTGVWLSGAAWLVFHYWLVEQGDFGPQPSPLEAWWLVLHAAFAFAAVWMFGLMVGTHAGAAWPSGRRRRSGTAVMGVLVLLVVTGYLLYYVGDDTVRSATAVVHWAVGLALPAMYAAHRVKRKGRVRHLQKQHQALDMRVGARRPGLSEAARIGESLAASSVERRA